MSTFSQKISTVFFLVLLLSSCGSEEAGGPQNNDPKPYKVMQITSKSTDLYTEFPATLQGKEDIEIRAKIDGYIESVQVDEGQFVKKDQVLFTISNPQYAQTLQNAEAAIEVAEAAVEAAQLQVNKTTPLVAQEIVSDYGLQTAKIDLKSKEANLIQAKANLANAKVNVGYLTIRSPFDGVIGTLPHKLGSYVSSNTSTPLTVVSNIHTIYAYFSINEKQYFTLFGNLEGKTIEDKIKNFAPVELVLANGSIYEAQGKIETISGQASPSTGSFNMRASFPNPSSLLRSGNSGKIRTHNEESDAILIPQNASYEIQGKRFVYTVDDQHIVHQKEIQIREVPGGQYFVVDSGVVSGETLVIEGVNTLKEGTEIVPSNE